MPLKTKQQKLTSEQQPPKGGYHPKKPNGWGAVAGIVVAFLLALLMLHWGVRYVAVNYRYFDPVHRQFMESPSAAEGPGPLMNED